MGCGDRNQVLSTALPPNASTTDLSLLAEAVTPPYQQYGAKIDIDHLPRDVLNHLIPKIIPPIVHSTNVSIHITPEIFSSSENPESWTFKKFLHFWGTSEESLNRAKSEVERVLEDFPNQSLSLPEYLTAWLKTGVPEGARGPIVPECYQPIKSRKFKLPVTNFYMSGGGFPIA